MDKFLIILCALLGLGMIAFAFPDGAISVLLVLFLSVPALFLMRRYSEDKEFLTRVFLIALIARLGLGLFIYFLDLKMLFGPDSVTYDYYGRILAEFWQGISVVDEETIAFAADSARPGWGMNYLTGFIYFICGPSMLVVQSFCGVVGAFTAPMVYFCAERVFNNQRVAKNSALLIALFPSMILWSAQMLKDGLIIFLLVAIMTLVLQLQKKFSYAAVVFLILSLFGILSLRFYIFYMVAVAVAGSFIIGLSTSVQSIVRNTIVVIIIGVSLTYLGIARNASVDFEKFGNLEKIQESRSNLALSSDSGFGEDIDVSTSEGAISAIPVGFTYLMLAPFPWQVSKLNQVIILPEVFLWWAMIPIMMTGLWYALKNRLRSALPILLFSFMLTIAYSITQGNVGMAYRQRTQIQVFLLIFIAVGWEIARERRENKITMRKTRQQQMRHRLQGNNVSVN